MTLTKTVKFGVSVWVVKDMGVRYTFPTYAQALGKTKALGYSPAHVEEVVRCWGQNGHNHADFGDLYKTWMYSKFEDELDCFTEGVC